MLTRRSRVVTLGACLLTAVCLSRSPSGADVRPGASPPPAHTEPITDTPSWPAPGNEIGPINPFASPAAGNIPARDLSPGDRAYIAAVERTAGQAPVQDAFARATEQAAKRAQVESAVRALGLRGLGDLGVLK